MNSLQRRIQQLEKTLSGSPERGPNFIIINTLGVEEGAKSKPAFAYLINAPCGTTQVECLDDETDEAFRVRVETIANKGMQA